MAIKSRGTNNSKLGYSEKSLAALERGSYDTLTKRDPKYRTSAQQTQQVRELPKLEGMTRSKSFSGGLSANNMRTKARSNISSATYKTSPVISSKILKTTPTGINLKDRGFSSSINNVPIDFDYVLKNDKVFGNKGFSMNALKSDLKARQRERDLTEKTGYQDQLSKERKKKLDETYYKRFGMSSDQVLDQYEQYMKDKEKASREKLPILSSLKDLISAPNRAGAGAMASLAHMAFPESDLDKFLNSDLMLREVKDVQEKRDYVQDSDKVSNTKKNIAKAVGSGSDFLANLATAGVVGAPMAIGDVASGTGTLIETAPWVGKALNGLLNLGSTAQSTKHDLEKQGIDSDTAYDLANASGAVAGAAGALMMNNPAASKGANWIVKALAEGGRMGGISAGSTALQEVANKLILDNQSTYDTDVNRYMAQGMTEDEAAKKAALNILGRVGLSGAGGFALGAGTSVASSALQGLLNKGVPNLNEYMARQEALPMNDNLGLPQNDIPALDGSTYSLALPEKQLPANVIRMPGTNGVIQLPLKEAPGAPEIIPNATPGESKVELLPNKSLKAENKVVNESAKNNPRMVINLEGEERAKVESERAQVKTRKKQINEELNALKQKDKLTKAETAQKKALTAEKNKLDQQDKDLGYRLDGKAKPFKEIMKGEDWEAYNNLYGTKMNKATGQMGTFGKIDNVVKFAGKTDEAVQLGKQIKQGFENYIESGGKSQVFDEIQDAANRLDALAKESDLIPFGDKKYVDRLAAIYGSDPETASIWDFLTNDINDAGEAARKLSSKYAIPEETPTTEAPSTEIPEESTGDRALTPEEVQKLQEGLAESERNYPGEYPEESLDAVAARLKEETLQNILSRSGNNDPRYELAAIKTRLNGIQSEIATLRNAKKLSDAQRDKLSSLIVQEGNLQREQNILSEYIANNPQSITTETAPTPEPQVTPQEQTAKPQQSNNGYWLRLLGDDNFLAQEAQKNNIDPAALRGIASQNLGYGDIQPTSGGNVPPKMPHMDGMMPGDNTKTSQTYTNTGRNGGGWNAEEYNKYTDPANYQYETIDEEQSIERATEMRNAEGREAFKNRVMNAERVSSVELDGLMMEWRDITEEARALEAAGKDASALWKESNRVFRAIQKQSTANAQALQALAKWSRNTPEGMLVEAENILNGKTKVKKSKIQEQLDKFIKENKKFEFSEDFVKEFLQEAEELRGLTGDALDSPMAKKKMAQLGKKINAQMPATIGEKLTSYLMDNMLGNFRTLITRNAGGNVGLNAVEQLIQRPVAAGVDMLASLKTGKRTQAGLSREGLAEYIQGFAKGLRDEASDVKTGLHTARSGENTLGNAIRSNRHVFNNPIMDKLDGLVKNGLSVGDRPFYEAVYKQTLGDYNRLRAKGKMGADVQNLSDGDFYQIAKTAAQINALSAVYQQDSMLSNALLEFKGAVGDLSRGLIGTDILSQFSMPFVKTPANVIERAIDYSPLGAVRNTIRTAKEVKNDAFDQNRFANETARNILGTALMAGGAGLAAKGVLSGAYSEDKDEKQAQKEAGEQEYAWNVPDKVPFLGGKQMDISWAPVVGSNMVAAAAAQDAYENGDEGLVGNLVKGAEAGGQALFDQSMFQGLQRLFGTGESYNSDEGIVANMGNVVKSGLSQFVPSLARQAGQVIDPYQRDLSNSNKELEFGPMDNYDINSLANVIPKLREYGLAPKVNTSGELIKENQGRSTGMKILEDMILPGKLTEVNYTRLAEEAKRLSDITTNKDAYMPKATRQYVDTEDHVLTNQEWTDYQQRYYKELTKAGEQLLDSDFYKSADAETQESVLSNVYSGLRSAINSEYNGKDVTGAAKKYVEAGGGDAGIQAVLSYCENSAKATELGLNVNTYEKKEAEYKGGAAQYAEDKKKADALGLSVDTYNKKQSEYKGGAEQYAKDKQSAIDNGFTDKEGNANMDAYDDAVELFGNNQSKLSSYQSYRAKGYTKDAQKIPELMNNNSFTAEEKGKILRGTDPSKLGKAAKGMYDIGGYEGVYYYYLLKNLADTNQNGSVTKAERKALLESNNKYVTSLPDDMYNYLGKNLK